MTTTIDPRRSSYVRIQRPTVMLVRVPDDGEVAQLLDEMLVRVLRVRHPLPACHRLRITRPHAVLVGPSVLPRDVAALTDVAFDVQAGILQLGPFATREEVRDWVLRVMRVMETRRAENGDQAREAG